MALNATVSLLFLFAFTAQIGAFRLGPSLICHFKHTQRIRSCSPSAVSPLCTRVPLALAAATDDSPSAVVVQQSYVEPEPEPEQEQEQDTAKLPTPKVGDVVRYRGKWADDIVLGEIRGLQYIAPRQKWIADVLPLKSVGNQQYARQREWGTTVQDVDTLRPVRAVYVRSANAFQVRVKNDDPKDIVYAGESYDLSNFALPPPRPVNQIAAELSLAEYEALKARMLSDTALFGATCAAATALFAGPEQGAVFALGAAAAVAYVALLGRNTDAIGTGGGDSLTAGQSRGSKALDATRLALPVGIVAVLAAAQFIRSPGEIHFLQLVPKAQFGAAMLGFLASYRLPLLYRELSRAVSEGSGGAGELLADALPGSLAAGSKLLRKLNADKEAAAAAAAAAGASSAGTSVVVVSGPRGLGRGALVQKLLQSDGSAAAAGAGGASVRQPVWCTARPQRAGEQEGMDYYFLSPMKFEEERLSRSGAGFLQVKEGADGELYGLREQEITERSSSGAVTVIDADVELVKQLMTLENTALIGVWVSLDSLSAIEDRLRSTLIAEQQTTSGSSSDSSSDSSSSATAVDAAVLEGRVSQALEDIEFGVTSGVFEFTIIDSEARASLAKLRKAVQYAR